MTAQTGKLGKVGQSNQYARWLTVTCWRKRDESTAVWFGTLACRSTPGAVAHVKRFFDIISQVVPVSRGFSSQLHPTTAHAYRITSTGNPLAPQAYSKNAIHRRLLPGRLPFLQYRQCLSRRDITGTSEPRPRSRLTASSCHPFDSARNGVS